MARRLNFALLIFTLGVYALIIGTIQEWWGWHGTALAFIQTLVTCVAIVLFGRLDRSADK